MSATLARKIRRIGLTRTTTVLNEPWTIIDEQGRETSGVATRTISNRHRIQYSFEEHKAIEAQIITAWRAKRKRGKS